MIKEIPNGVYPTMITPFTDDNRIDYGGVERLLHWYGERGVAGIFALCQSSEIFFLSFKEKLQLLEFIMEHRPTDMVVVASGHTASDTKTQIAEANAYIEQGIDAYVFISNRFAREDENDEVFIKNMHTIISSIPEICLGIYECPYPYKRIMTPSLLRSLLKTERFQFMKDTCCDLQIIKQKLDVLEGTYFKLFNANSATLLESLKLGCKGYSGVMGNFHPEIYSWLCNNYNLHEEKSQMVQDIIGFFSLAECQYYPVNAKYYLGLEGLGIGYHSRALNPEIFTDNRKMEIDQMWRLTHVIKELIQI